MTPLNTPGHPAPSTCGARAGSTPVGTVGRPPHFDGRALLLAVGVLLWLAMAIIGPPHPAHAAAAGYPDPLPSRHPATSADPPAYRGPLAEGHLPADVLRRFEPPAVPWAPGHRGVDLAAAAGTPVLAVRAGVVSFAGTIAGTGVVSVTHPGTGEPALRTTYEPVQPLVAVGAQVTAGEVIGRVAAGSGHCPTSCLHWGLLRGRRYLDPLALVGLGRARLLPLL